MKSPDDTDAACPKCGGTGERWYYKDSEGVDYYADCFACQGTGQRSDALAKMLSQ